MVWIFVFLVVSINCVTGRNMGTSGIATLVEGGACKNDGNTDIYTKKKSDDMTVINGTIDFPVDITDKLQLLFVVEKFDKGNWKTYMEIKGKVCEQVNNMLPIFMKRVSQHTKPAMSTKCPFKRGKYTLANLLNKIDFDEINLPTVPYGKFRFTMQFNDGNKTVFCIKFDPVLSDPK